MTFSSSRIDLAARRLLSSIAGTRDARVSATALAHMRGAGWTALVVDLDDLAPIRARHGIPDRLASCHTGVVGRYAIEGHVPASDVERLVREAPAARALTAPGMPAGSPGMEAAGREPYVTLLILADGSTRPFGRHNGA